VEGAVDVTVELDVDAADRPRDMGVVIVEALVSVLDFLSEDREGGGGGKGTPWREKSSRPRLLLRVCWFRWEWDAGGAECR